MEAPVSSQESKLVSELPTWCRSTSSKRRGTRARHPSMENIELEPSDRRTCDWRPRWQCRRWWRD